MKISVEDFSSRLKSRYRFVGYTYTAYDDEWYSGKQFLQEDAEHNDLTLLAIRLLKSPKKSPNMDPF
jgi:hypothetical protein